MTKQLRLVIAIIIIIGFVLNGIYILKISNTLASQIIGWSNIIFFGGFFLWAFFKYKNNKNIAYLKLSITTEY